MRVVYYVRPSGLDYVFCQVFAMSALVDIHLVLEISPENHGMTKFGALPNGLPGGVHYDGWRFLAGWLPVSVEDRLRQTAGFHLVVHHCRRAFYPRTLLVAARAAALIRSLHPDVVHFDETWTRAAWIFPLLGRLPIVANVHDIEEHPGDPQSRIQMVRRWAWRYVSRLIFFSRYCECVYLDKSDGPRVPTSVVPLGAYEVFRAWETHSVAEEPQTVLFFGRLSLYKGLHVLLDAAPLVAREIPNVHFIIAGAPVPGYVVPDIPVLPNGARIEMIMQFVPADRLCELFQRSALVVLPYTSATQSGVVMTAYAFHKPVVTTHVGGLPEVVSDGVTGRLVTPHDPVALAKAIIDLLRDSGLRAQIARNVRCRVESELSWDRAAEMTMSVYQSVLWP